MKIKNIISAAIIAFIVNISAGCGSASNDNYIQYQYVQWENYMEADAVIGQADMTSTEAGTTASRMNNPYGMVYDYKSGKIYIADRDNNRILRFATIEDAINDTGAEAVFGQPDMTSGSANKGGTVSASSISSPTHVCVDSEGRLWVTDSGNNRVLCYYNAAIKESNSDADIVLGQTDFVSNDEDRGGSVGINTMDWPSGLFIDKNNHLWISDSDNHRVLRYDNISSISSGADADGILGQADFTAESINRTDTTTPAANSMYYPYLLWCDNNGTLYVVESHNSRVTIYLNAAGKSNGADSDIVLGQPDFTTLAYHATYDTTAATLHTPRGVCVDDEGYVYVTDSSRYRVLIWKASSVSSGHDADYVLGQADFTTYEIGVSAKDMAFGRSLFFDNRNKWLWVTESYNSRVIRFSPEVL